jgi:hypothetical protein
MTLALNSEVNVAIAPYKQKFGFQLQTIQGFTPPQKVQALGQDVELDLAVGLQSLWTKLRKKSEVSDGRISDWKALTVPDQEPHRFTDSTMGEETESNKNDSCDFSKIVGLAFMEEYADACWYSVLSSLWGNDIDTSLGKVAISKRQPNEYGPDYLAAPFDPSDTTRGGPFFAVEVKGRKEKIEFAHDQFKKWSIQSQNIKLLPKQDHGPVNMKSWVLAFNYGFAEPKGSREFSTLLVEDPEIEPGQPFLEASRLNGSTIIRDHLSRQCSLLGASALAPFVRLGKSIEGNSLRPYLWKVNHQRLQNRRYIGTWFFIDENHGDLIQCPFKDRPVFWDEWFGNERLVFLGQDANMLKICTRTRIDQPLSGEAFQDEIHFYEPQFKIRVLRNGSILAAGTNMRRDSDWEKFWSQ